MLVIWRLLSQDVIDSCHTNAWVTTISGRRRYLPHIRGKGEQTAQAERQAVNTVCQGSAADIVKGVMIELIQQLEDLELSKYCRLLLQVGDHLRSRRFASRTQIPLY